MSTGKTNEEVRGAAIDYLAARPRIAQCADTIHRRLARENPDWTLEDVKDALQFLKDEGLVGEEPDTLGSTLYYRATSKGCLFVERRYGIQP